MRVITHLLLWRLGLAKAETQTSEAERDCLARVAAGKKRLVEIGVWHGVTTCRLRKAMCPDGLLFAVDPYPVGRSGLQRTVANCAVRGFTSRQRKSRVDAFDGSCGCRGIL